MDKQPKTLASHNNSNASPALIDRAVGLTITVIKETEAIKVSSFSDGTIRTDHKYNKRAMPEGLNESGKDEGTPFEVQ